MDVEVVIRWILCGFVIGLVARALVPGRQSLGCLTTVALGIAGSFLGGFIYSQVMGPSTAPFAIDGHHWYGWGVSILGAVLLLVVAIVLLPGDERS